jgi:HlyD family secretion protein
LLVDLRVSEIDISKVELGQRVILTLDAVLAGEYQGKVIEISPVGDVNEGVVTFDVTVELIDADVYVRPGMTTTVKIEVGRVEDALLIPSRAIRSLEGQRVVYVLGGGAISEQLESDSGWRASDAPAFFDRGSALANIYPVPITVGISSADYIEIIDGDLQEGDVIVLDPPSELLNPPLGHGTP